MKNIIYDKSGKVNKNLWIFLIGIVFSLTFVLSIITTDTINVNNFPMNTLIYNFNGTNFTFYDKDLLLFYNFDNDSGLGENSSWVRDFSLIENNLTISPSKCSFISAKYGLGLYGNHTDPAINSCLGNSAGVSLKTSSHYSISFWANSSDNGTSNYVFESGVEIGAHSSGKWIVNNAGQGSNMIPPPENTLASNYMNQSVFIVVVKNGTFDQDILYINGTQVYNESTNGGSIDVSSTKLMDTSTSSPFYGWIDNLMIFNRSLNDSEVEQFYFMFLKKVNDTSWDLYVNQSESSTTELSVNNYTYYAWANDTSSNSGIFATKTITINSSSQKTFETNISIIFTNIPVNIPNITLLNQFPTNASTYSSTQFYSFNATIVNKANDVDDIRFEFNNVNYTPVNDTLNPTIFNITLPIQLGTGIYSYKWIANDSLNNKNVTSNATTVLNATSVGNLTLNEFDRNITVHTGRQFTINATLLTGVFNGANINLTMNGTELNFSTTTNISHILTLNKRESGVNFTMFYSGNQNFSSFSETWFVEVAGVNVTLINPANELNSSTANTTFGANGSTSYGVLTNSTLIIWNSTGWRIYNETNTETAGVDNSTIRNISRILDSDDYLWNYEFCNNESSCGFATTNNTLRVYGGNFGINTVDFSNSSLNELSFVRIALSPFSVANNYIKYWNITVRHPDGGSLLFDDVNATWGFFNPDRYNTTNTLNFNKTGIYEINTTLTDRYGTTIIKMQNITIGYSLTSSPNNHSFAAITSRTETNTIDYVVYDDSEGYINLSVVARIRDSPNFTLVLSQSSILLNNSESSSIPFRFYLNVTGGSDVANGTYNGNITIRNDTYGIYRQINFTYYIQPPSGVPTIRQQGTTTACTTFTTDACAVKRDNMSVGDTFSKVWSINNTGGYQLKRCDAQYIGTFKDASFISFSQTNFTLDVNNSIDLTATFTPTGLSPGYGTFEDYLKIYCIDGDIGGNPTSTPASGWVYSRIIIKEPGFEGQGGGGSPPGGGGGPGGVKIIVTQGNWTMKTNTGTSAYQLKVSPGQKRTDKTLLFKNIGNIPIPVNLTCEGSLCSNIEFEQTSFLLPVNKALITEKGFTLNVPEDLVEGSYSINLVAIDNLKQREVVTVNFDVSKINILAPFQKAISGKIKFLKGTISLWIILLVILILTIILSYNLIWKKFSLGPFFSFLTGFAAMVVALILFNTIEPVT